MRHKLSVYLKLVMFSHSLFSLPYAVCTLLLLQPTPQRWILILLALISARTLANAVNRVADCKYDRLNPRTADRPLCTGEATLSDTAAFSGICAIVLFLSTLLLAPQLVLLLPVAGFLFVFYPLTKRFTVACHFVLGAVCALSVVGVCLACDAPVYWPLAIACALSVAGFDILYAIEDIDFDRAFALHSIPARYGPRAAVMAAVFCFFVSAVCMETVLPSAAICLYAVFCIAAALAFAGAYRIAAYRMNQTAGVIILLLFGIHCIVN